MNGRMFYFTSAATIMQLLDKILKRIKNERNKGKEERG
jgi:hypothetical protein